MDPFEILENVSQDANNITGVALALAKAMESDKIDYYSDVANVLFRLAHKQRKTLIQLEAALESSLCAAKAINPHTEPPAE